MDNTNLARISIKDIIMIMIGTGFYGWSLININITNQLAEGGLSGITLILLALFNWNPAYTNLILNIPLLIIGYRVLGRRSLIYTIWGIISLSFWLYVWQKFPMPPALHHDMLIAGLLAGIMSGIGLGVVFRFGGTSGGTDVIARIMEQKLGIQIGRTMFALDAVVLASIVARLLPAFVVTVSSADFSVCAAPPREDPLYASMIFFARSLISIWYPSAESIPSR